MATITGFTFDTAQGAGKMLDLLQDLSRQQLITVEDAAIVTWPQGKKKPKTKHLDDLVHKLLENGYSEEDCGKFLGGNSYRVFKQVWK